MPWYAGAIIIWAGAAIVAAYVRRLGLKTRGIVLGLVAAIVLGAIMGAQMPADDPVLNGSGWVGGCAGLVGACSPWAVRAAKDAVAALVKRAAK
jgi:hypothetical protein